MTIPAAEDPDIMKNLAEIRRQEKRSPFDPFAEAVKKAVGGAEVPDGDFAGVDFSGFVEWGDFEFAEFSTESRT